MKYPEIKKILNNKDLKLSKLFENEVVKQIDLSGLLSRQTLKN